MRSVNRDKPHLNILKPGVDNMKTRHLALTALTVLLAVSSLLLAAQASTTETFTVTHNTYQVTFNLPAGTEFNGSLSTTATVRVWVSDANGSLVTNLGLVDSTASFSFVAAQEGNYHVYFENSLSTSAEVAFTYETDPELGGGSLLPFWLWPVFVAVTVGGCIAVLYLSRRRKVRHSEE
jgi:hypothetical protein